MSDFKEKDFSDVIAMKIEKKVAEICDEAGIDYGERPLFQRELFDQIEADCIEGNKTMSDEASLESALSRFGDSEFNSPFVQDPWYYRLLWYQRSASVRIFIILLSTLYVERYWVATSYWNELTESALKQTSTYAYMRLSLIGPATLTLLYFFKWSPYAKIRPLHFVAQLILLLYFFLVPLHIAVLVIGWAITLLAVPCILSEVLRWSESASHVKMSQVVKWKGGMGSKVSEEE